MYGDGVNESVCRGCQWLAYWRRKNWTRQFIAECKIL